MSSPLTSGGPKRYSARVSHCLKVDWCVSLLVRLICCWVILTASSPGRLLVCCLLSNPSTSLITFAFRSNEVRRLLLDLDPCGGTDPLGMFRVFFVKRIADVLAQRLSVAVRQLVRLGSFQLCGDRPTSLQFRKVRHPPLLPITNRFSSHQCCRRCLSTWCLFALDNL